MKKTTRFFLGLDQGSSGSKAALVDSQGRLEWEALIPVSMTTRGREVEQDPDELAASVSELVQKAKDWVTSKKGLLTAAGLASQRSGVCAWDANTSTVRHPLISWRDTRTHEWLAARDLKEVTVMTGLPVSAHFAGRKISLLQEQFSDKKVAIGTLDSFLVARLGAKKNQFVTEDSMAHRTMLYSFSKLGWDQSLCELFQVDRKRLPKIQASVSDFGEIGGVPLCFMIGDQQAALLRHTHGQAGGMLNLGTIGSVLLSTGAERKLVPGFVPSVFYSTPAPSDRGRRRLQYVVGGTVNICGQTVSVIRERLHIEPQAIDTVCREASQSKDRLQALAFCPFGNTTTPDWVSNLPDVTLHLVRDEPAQTVRVLIENLGNFIAENILALREAGLFPSDTPLPVSGGVSRIDYLLQYIADLTGVVLTRVDDPQMGAQGAALGAMLGAGEPITQVQSKPGKTFRPERSQASERFAQWKLLKKRVAAGDLSGMQPF